MHKSHKPRFYGNQTILLLIVLLGVFGSVTSPGLSSAQNPDPAIQVLYPNGGETLNGTVLIQWEVQNPPNETLRFTVSYWFWEEPKWVPIVSGITGTSYPWGTREVPNGQYVIQVSITSVSPVISDESDNFFTVDNGALPRVRVYYPNGGEILGGTVLLTWSMLNPEDYDVTFEVYYWNGADWLLLIGGYPSVSYSWDTTKVPDGSYYRIKLILYSELGTSEDTSDGTFTIHNGEQMDHAPTVHVLYPNGGETLTDYVIITWTATDPDENALTYSLRCWDGAQWLMLAQNIQTTNWTWNTLQYTNGTSYVLEVMVSDGTFFSADQSDTIFSIRHLPPVIDLLAPLPAINESVAVLTDMAWINWTVTNPANYNLTFGIDLWLNNEWFLLARNLTTNFFHWNTQGFPDGDTYKLRVLAYFGPQHSEEIMPSFTIANVVAELRGRLPEVEIEAPHGGVTWKGPKQVKWVGADPDGNRLTYTVHYWNGTRWALLAANLQNTSLVWDTSRLSSRTDYRVRITAFDGIDRGLGITEEFAIGGNPPQIEFSYPRGGESLQGNVTLAWSAFDPDERELTYTLEYKHRGNWTLLAANITGTTILWNSRTVENGQDYQLRLTGNNGLLTARALVDEPLVITNNFPPAITVTWPNGGEELQGTVDIRWNVIDLNDPPEALRYTVSYYKDEEEWIVLSKDLHATHYMWDTMEAPNLNWTVIRVQVTDSGNLTAVDDSDSGFKVVNHPIVSAPPPPGPSRGLKWMFYGIIIMFMALTTLVAYGKGLERAKKTEQAEEDKIKLKRRIKKVQARLKMVEKQHRALRRTPQLSGWPKDLMRFQTRLENLEQRPFVEEYLYTLQDAEEQRDTLNHYLNMLGAQVTTLLTYLKEEPIESHEGIGISELRTFAENPVTFFEARSFGVIVPLAKRVRDLIKEAQVSWKDHKLAPEPFSEVRIGTLLKQEQALLKVQTDLNEKAKLPQVEGYLQVKELFEPLLVLEQKIIRNQTLLQQLNVRLTEVKAHSK